MTHYIQVLRSFFSFRFFLLHQHCRGSLDHSLVVQFVSIIALIATGIKL